MKLQDKIYLSQVELSEVEKKIISSKYLKRLKHVSHAGVASIGTNLKHSRFDHTIGVFILTKLLLKNENEELSLSVLLHDTGHFPFSHSCESAFKRGKKLHKDFTKKILNSVEIRKILGDHGFSADRIWSYIEKKTHTVVFGKSGNLSLDNLDSFLRDGFYLKLINKKEIQSLVNDLKIINNNISLSFKWAKKLIEIMFVDQAHFYSREEIIRKGLLIELVKRLLDGKIITIDKLQSLTDKELISFVNKLPDFEYPKIKKLCLYLMGDLNEFEIVREGERSKSKTLIRAIELRNNYLSDFLVGNKSTFQVFRERTQHKSDLLSLMGEYRIHMKGEL